MGEFGIELGLVIFDSKFYGWNVEMNETYATQNSYIFFMQ